MNTLGIVTMAQRNSDQRDLEVPYKPFPSFAEWSKCTIDDRRWQRYSDHLDALRISATPDRLKAAQAFVERAAAVDTGAIEGLYETDRGFTLSIATQAAYWQSLAEARGSHVRALIEAQLSAYQYVLDLATRKTPIAESWIRQLHVKLCEAQTDYDVITEAGVQRRPLPKGVYKQHPNHIFRADGKRQATASADTTPMEMERLCRELRSDAFEHAHPVLQASYAHYGLALIHPFADGNGRMARALASVYTYRAHSVPLIILVGERGRYYDALEAADAGDHQAFVSFMLERTLDGVQLIEAGLYSADAPAAEESVGTIRNLYFTSGGYTQEVVDKAGYLLMTAFYSELAKRVEKETIPNQLAISLAVQQCQYDSPPGYRAPILAEGNRCAIMTYLTYPPAAVSIAQLFVLDVPKDCGRDDDIVIRSPENNTDRFAARMAEVWPEQSTALQLRMTIVIDGLVRRTLARLSRQAAAALEHHRRAK